MKTYTEQKIIRGEWNPIEHLNESENLMVQELLEEWEAQGIDIRDIDEGFLGKLIGGAAGFVVGPSIGRAVAKALGIQKGILYDLFNSRLVGAALGAAVAKSIGKK